MDIKNLTFLIAVEAFACIEFLLSRCLVQYQRETFELASMKVIYPIVVCIAFGLLLGVLFAKLGDKLRLKTFVWGSVINIIISTGILVFIHTGYNYFLILAGVSMGGILKCVGKSKID